MSIKTYKLLISIVISILIQFISMINCAEFQCSKFLTECECVNETVICVGSKNPDGIDSIRLKPPRLEIKCSKKNALIESFNNNFWLFGPFIPKIQVGQFAEELFIENCMLNKRVSFRRIKNHFNISRLRTVIFSTKSNFSLFLDVLRDLEDVENVYFDGPITFHTYSWKDDSGEGYDWRRDYGGNGGNGGDALNGASRGTFIEVPISFNEFSIMHKHCEKSFPPSEIHITNNPNAEIFSRFLLKCAADLEQLYYMGNDVQTLDPDLFANSKNLTILSLADNNLETLPDNIFQNHQKLIELDLSFNRLRTIKSVILECNQTLIILRLSHNHLEYIPEDLLNRLSALEELYLDNNKLKTITYDVSSSLKIVKLTNNSLTRIWHPSNKELTTLDLSCNRIEHLDLGDFISIRNGSFTVDLSKNWIQSIYNNKTAYKFINTELIKYADAMKRPDIQWNWILNDNPLNCDCETLHFSNILNEKADIRKYLNLIANKLECNATGKLNGKLISQVHPSDLLCPYNCSIIADKSAACECWIRSFDNVLLVNCSNMALTKVPNLLSLSKKSNLFKKIELIIANNNIEILSSVTMPDNINKINAENNSIRTVETVGISMLLEELNLAGNDLQTLNRSLLLRLNGTLNKLILQRNPWKCDCNEDFMNYMKLYPDKVNYASIRCFDGKSLSETEQICSQHFKILLIIYTIVGFLFGGLIALYYKFKLEIKIWLFANKICLCLIKEYEIDEEKEYDAFMSYSYKDQEFVHSLTLKLESGPNPFKICIDSRDWLAGGLIPESIASSVLNSRRTIVVLSKEFLKSVWGTEEFRAAHKLAIKEGRVRLIVIMMEEIKDTEELLCPEMSLYLKTNTYLKRNDPHFYDKLYYALPHSPGNRKAKNYKSPDQFEMMTVRHLQLAP